MKISVILPTYKPQDYIYECLGSLRDQTLDKSLYEVIIILNGCNEPWHTQLRKYIEDNMSGLSVRLIQTDRGGVSNARNMAIDRAAGEYITFIDDDDYVSPAYLEELLKNSSPDCVALTDSLYVNDDTGEISSDNSHHRRFEINRKKGSPTLFESRVFFNGPVMKLIHRDIVGKRRFDIRFANGEDNLMMFRISDKVKNISYTSPAAIYYRRIRENSATTRYRTRTEIYKNALKIMGQYLKYILNNPFGYNYPFVLSRFAAELKSIIVR